MKRLQILIIMVLISPFFTSIILAYKPGPKTIRECPYCKLQLEQQTTMSGNTFGARFWTDGKMQAPMLPNRPRLVKCPKCGSIIWIDEAKEIGKENLWDEQKKWPDAKKPSLLVETDILNLLSSDKLSNKKELYARRLSWWKANDTVRMNVSSTVNNFSPGQQENMRTLAELLDEKEANQRIMKAEIYRELGKFKVCIRILGKNFEKDHHAKVADFIRKLAEQNIRIVREIKED